MGFWEFDDPPTQQVKAQVVDLDHHSSAREEAHEKDFFKTSMRNVFTGTTSPCHGGNTRSKQEVAGEIEACPPKM